MQFITDLVANINGLLWNSLLLILLCGTGFYFTLRLKFVQVTKFGAAFKSVFGSISLKGEKAGDDGMSSFQSLATAIAAQVGTGNLAGAATAIASGGPGAIFWMWLSAFFGMATIFAEATVAQQYKTTVDGKVTGGPSYYIKGAFKGAFGKILAGIFAVLIVLALGFFGNMVQSNSIGDAFNTAFGITPLVTGIVLAIIAAFIFLGGVTRIASFAEKVVPIMALLYIIGAVVVLGMNVSFIAPAFKAIFVGAFNPQAIAGGALGVTVQKAIRFGVARGLFSNEAGMGSTPHAHAVAKVNHPCDQGLVAMMGVFIDTFIVLTLTALVVVIFGLKNGFELTGIALTQAAFADAFGAFGNIFVAVCLLFFAFTTIIGWYFFGEANVRYLFGKTGVLVYSVIVLGFIVLGSCLKVGLVWDLSDMFNGLMVIPNLIALVALSGGIAKCYNDYKNK